jgi:hypothetical protein
MRAALDKAACAICICESKCFETRHGMMQGPCEKQIGNAAKAIAAFLRALPISHSRVPFYAYWHPLARAVEDAERDSLRGENARLREAADAAAKATEAYEERREALAEILKTVEAEGGSDTMKNTKHALDAAARALHKAGEQFVSYADQHAAKGTADGDHKAATNQQWAERCFDAHDAALNAAAEAERAICFEDARP